MEWINDFAGLLTVIGGVTSVFLTFIFTLRYSKKKAVSSVKKDIQLNTAEGNMAESTFIDRMIERGEMLAEKIYKEQIKKQEAETQMMKYKAAFNHLFIACEESCDDSKACKEKLNQVMKNFRLDENG